MPEELKAADAPDSQRAVLRLLTAKWISQAVSVCAELGIADILKNGPQSPTEIATVAGASEHAVFRLCRTLASLGLLSSEGQRFALTESGQYLRSDVPGSLRGLARFFGHDATWRPWGKLAYSVRTGKPAFDHVFGVPTFEHLSRDVEAAAIFNEAMTSVSTIDAKAVVDAYDFSSIRTLVDVGGGYGLLLATALTANPNMRGVLFELPHAIDGAATLLKREGVANRCELRSGDFFQSVPEGGDAYALKRVIHDWDDDRALQILRNCHRVMRASGRLLVIDCVIRPGDEPDSAKLLDLEMLVLTSGGRERSEPEFHELFAKAGFLLTQVVPTAVAMSVIEGVKL
jgi:hypothetical protein